MFCSNCGNKLEEGARFCSACSCSVPDMTAHMPSKAAQRGRKTGIIIAVGMAIALCCGLYVIAKMRSGDESDDREANGLVSDMAEGEDGILEAVDITYPPSFSPPTTYSLS